MLRARTGRIDPEELQARLEARGFRLRALDGLPSFFRVETEPWPVALTLEHWLGLFYVQQASTGVAAPALAPRPGERVLDLCAAPGGKTTHLAELMHDTGCLVAADVSETRMRGLLGNVYRLGHTGVLVVAADGTAFPEEARFDRVLVDAPCSGEGTLRKRSGRPPRQSRSFRGHVRGVQERLLRRAVRVTRPGGTILYVTCTFAPEENEAVVDAVLADEPVRLEPLELPVPHAPGLTAFEEMRFAPELEGAARIYPHHFDSGGLFVARLARLDDGARPVSDETSWKPVPRVFPGDAMPAAAAAHAWARALEELDDRFGLDREALATVAPVFRGGRAWLHSLDAWPLEAWRGDAWRPISLGFRAVEFDSGGYARPTNDLLQWAGSAVRSRVVDVDPGELRRLLARERVGCAQELRGPVALRHRGDVLGRARAAAGSLESEVPKTRAADLGRVLDEMEREGG